MISAFLLWAESDPTP